MFWQHLIGTRQQAVPVVDGNTYLGLAGADELGRLERAAWADTTVADVMRTDVPIATPDWLLADAIRAMDDAGTDRLAVCAADQFLGVIHARDLVPPAEHLNRPATADRKRVAYGKRGQDRLGPG